MHVDVVVVGRGLIGSAAARHLAESGRSVALVGPLEAADRVASQGPFSSHPDQGRITRIFGRTPVWSTVAGRAIGRYADISARSGVDFYTPSGCVAVIENASAWIDHASGFDLDASVVEAAWLLESTGIAAPAGYEIAYERSPAGHINPRRLVAAQAVLVEQAGGHLVEEAADTLARVRGRFTVGGSWGEVTGDRVLLATGAFGSELLEVELDVERRARSILLAEMPERPDLPCLISMAPDEQLNEIYWVPPVEYPDGRMCLKIGGDMVDTRVLESDELVEWFHGAGAAEEVTALENSLRSLLPDAEIATVTSEPCVITGTPTGHPYIGWIDDGVAVAIAGNGSAAKSSDELGRLASTLFSDDGWTDSLDASIFVPRSL